MVILGIALSVFGLILVAVAGLVLLPKIFISDEELDLLAELPIQQSTSHMTDAVTGQTSPVAVINVPKLIDYRRRYIEARKQERRNGRIGLWLVGGGSLLQIIGVILSGIYAGSGNA